MVAEINAFVVRVHIFVTLLLSSVFIKIEEIDMCLAQKIELENTIFACAGRLCGTVHAYAGRLICTERNAYLQALLQVYNAFFYEDNWNSFCAQETQVEYPRNVSKRALCTILLSKKEYKFELLEGGKNAL